MTKREQIKRSIWENEAQMLIHQEDIMRKQQQIEKLRAQNKILSREIRKAWQENQVKTLENH